MKVKYECSYCHKQFQDRQQCYEHEMDEHLQGADKIKYCIINVLDENPCRYCKNLYYIYGSEPNCSHNHCAYNNNYKDFSWNGGDINYGFERDVY